MAIPPEKEIRIPLLHLIHFLGGVGSARIVCDALAKYFKLSKEEMDETLPSGRYKKFDNHVQAAKNMLCSLGLLDNSARGLWKITEKGRQHLSKMGLLDKSFLQDVHELRLFDETQLPKPEDQQLLELVIDEVVPNGPKRFPEDFCNNDCGEFYELELPGIQLQLAPLSNTTIVSRKGYFRYQAKNPPEAKYILYANNVGSKKIKIPKDNLTLFKMVKGYEKYCNEIIQQAFQLFLEFTNDEARAEYLLKQLEKKLDLRFNSNK